MAVTTKSAVIEALKEMSRLVVLAIPGAALLVVTDSPELSALYGGLILTMLRGIDKYVHENPDTFKNGILPF